MKQSYESTIKLGTLAAPARLVPILWSPLAEVNVFKRLVAVPLLVMASLVIGPAHGGVITGEVKNLDGKAFIRPPGFDAQVETRNGTDITKRAAANFPRAETTGEGNAAVTRFRVEFDETRLSDTDKLINVTLTSTGSRPVFLLGLDGGTGTLNINIIMPEDKAEPCPPIYTCPCEHPCRLGLGWRFRRR